MTPIQDQIQQSLRSIQIREGVRIIHACESGSRAWGFASPDSDYDVRILYMHPVEDYLRVHDIPGHITDEISGDLDVSGWDLRKALRLVGRSNAVVFEWLQSPVVYQSQKTLRDMLWQSALECFQPKNCILHYLGTVHKSLSTIDQGTIRIKKYFYVLRPLLAAMWIVKTNKVPPMEFAALKPILDDYPIARAIVDELWEKKKESIESARVAIYPELQSFIDQAVDTCKRTASSLEHRPYDVRSLDATFRRCLEYQAP
jgi:uncharacterized protein